MSAPQPEPHAADDSRARPQYGEYATAEEQRSRIQHPSPPAADPVPPAASRPVAPQPGFTAPPSWGAPAAPTPQRSAAHPADRIATILLLAAGAGYITLSLVSFLNLPATMAQTYRVMGVPGTFANVDSARLWGIIAAILLVAGYIGTLLLSLRNLRRGVLAWWIPLVGAAVTLVIVWICVAVPLLGDPAFMQYVTTGR